MIPYLVLSYYKDTAWPDRLWCIVPCKTTTVHLLPVHIQLVLVPECIVCDADVSPEPEGRHLSVPGAVLGAPLAHPECPTAKMILRIQLVGLLIIKGIGPKIHPWSCVIQLEPELGDTDHK